MLFKIQELCSQYSNIHSVQCTGILFPVHWKHSPPWCIYKYISCQYVQFNSILFGYSKIFEECLQNVSSLYQIKHQMSMYQGGHEYNQAARQGITLHFISLRQQYIVCHTHFQKWKNAATFCCFVITEYHFLTINGLTAAATECNI